jgi:hypothetical protein
VWKFFLGACVLTAAMLQPHAPVKSILGGMGLSGLVVLVWTLASRGRPGADGLDKSNQSRSDPDAR